MLAAAGPGPHDLSVAEIMEAYAVQAIACVEGAGLDPASSTPVAARSPAVIPSVLRARSSRYVCSTTCGRAHGLAAIAAAGGLGTALLLST